MTSESEQEKQWKGADTLASCWHGTTRRPDRYARPRHGSRPPGNIVAGRSASLRRKARPKPLGHHRNGADRSARTRRHRRLNEEGAALAQPERGIGNRQPTRRLAEKPRCFHVSPDHCLADLSAEPGIGPRNAWRNRSRRRGNCPRRGVERAIRRAAESCSAPA